MTAANYTAAAGIRGLWAGPYLDAVHGADAWPGQWVSGVLECEPEKGRPGVVNPLGREFWATDLLGQADRLAGV